MVSHINHSIIFLLYIVCRQQLRRDLINITKRCLPYCKRHKETGGNIHNKRYWPLEMWQYHIHSIRYRYFTYGIADTDTCEFLLLHYCWNLRINNQSNDCVGHVHLINTCISLRYQYEMLQNTSQKILYWYLVSFVCTPSMPILILYPSIRVYRR